MTEEELKVFLEQNDIELQDTSSTKSINSNYLIINRNFERLKLRFNLMFKAIGTIYEMINVDNIVQQVIDKMSQSKINILIPVTIKPNQVINDGTYKVTRDTTNVCTIERMVQTNDWLTDNFVVQVKNDLGQIVYPVITTKNNKVKIYFIDGLTTNYNVFIL